MTRYLKPLLTRASCLAEGLRPATFGHPHANCLLTAATARSGPTDWGADRNDGTRSGALVQSLRVLPGGGEANDGPGSY